MTENKYSKILVLGAGPVVIGSSSEYDYSAASVCRALKEEGISVVSVNSNPDTIMTDKNVADTVYIEPLNGETVKKIIEKKFPMPLSAPREEKRGSKFALSFYKTVILMSTVPSFSELSRKP